ncbi:MAG: DUF2330 domain-containing protein [Candidatus Eisenbacteria bacterium]
MRSMHGTYLRAGLLITLLSLASSSRDRALAVCCPFPCESCNLQSMGQLNFVRFDRRAGSITLVPNLRFRGTSPDFALVVPTPAVPTLAPVAVDFWEDASRMTSGDNPIGSNDAPLSCRQREVTPAYAPVDDEFVTVHAIVQVGGMLATILSSTNADTLVTWLNRHDYRVAPGDAEKFAPYIAREWFFTAMRPDSSDTSHPMPQSGWDSNVSPVEFVWSGDRFELPLEILDINRGESLPVVLYVLDEHRVEMEGFTVRYANRLSDGELRAAQSRFPAFARQLETGAWLTRLTRTFGRETSMNGALPLVRAERDEEYRGAGGFFYADAWLLAATAGGLLLAARRRKRL